MHMADVTLGSLGANGVVCGRPPAVGGRRADPQAARRRPGVRLLLRRRRIERRRVPREHQHGRRLEAAGHLPLREQPVRHVHVGQARAWRLPISPTARWPTASPARRSTGWTCWRSTRPCSGRPRTPVPGNGPVLINAVTYRYFGHSKSDKQRYRTKEEVEAWRAKDPLVTLPRSPDRRTGILTEADAAALDDRAQTDDRRRHRLGRRRARAVGRAPDGRCVRR